MTRQMSAISSQKLKRYASSLAIIIMFTGAGVTAHADRAPVRFMGDKPSSERVVPNQLNQAESQTRSEPILEYRYADQPDVVYGASANNIPSDLSDFQTTATQEAFDPRAAARRLASKPVSEPPRVAPRTVASNTSAQAPALSQPEQQTQTSVETTRLAGTGFTPVSDTKYDATGIAHIYAEDFLGEPTATGEILNRDRLTAAHPTLPLPSLVQVINAKTGREIVVRINDRGPFDGGGILELTPRAASLLGMSSEGGDEVRVRYLGPAAPTRPTDVALTTPSAPRVLAAPSLPETTSIAPESNGRIETSNEIMEKTDTLLQTLQSDPANVETTEPAVEQKPILSLDMAPKGAANFFVQVGSFGEFENAVAFRESLMTNYNVGIVEVTVNGRDYYRVVVGPFDYRSTAVQTRAALRRSGVEGIVIPANAN